MMNKNYFKRSHKTTKFSNFYRFGDQYPNYSNKNLNQKVPNK